MQEMKATNNICVLWVENTLHLRYQGLTTTPVNNAVICDVVYPHRSVTTFERNILSKLPRKLSDC